MLFGVVPVVILGVEAHYVKGQLSYSEGYVFFFCDVASQGLGDRGGPSERGFWVFPSVRGLLLWFSGQAVPACPSCGIQ